MNQESGDVSLTIVALVLASVSPLLMALTTYVQSRSNRTLLDKHNSRQLELETEIIQLKKMVMNLKSAESKAAESKSDGDEN